MVELSGPQTCYGSQEPSCCQTTAVGKLLSHCCCRTLVVLMFLFSVNGLTLHNNCVAVQVLVTEYVELGLASCELCVITILLWSCRPVWLVGRL
jgi:hypothetical protein